MRRIMFLWHLLHRDGEEVINKVYTIQKCHENKGDWAKIVNEERIKYCIIETNEEICKMSKTKFRKIVKKKIKLHATKYLDDLAKPHSKSAKIRHNVLKKKSYFTDRRFSREDVQLLFQLKTKMINCKSNFSNAYDNQLQCRMCEELDSVENEDHLLTCSVLNTEKYDVQYSDVFESIDKQYSAVKVFKNVLRKRQVYLDNM